MSKRDQKLNVDTCTHLDLRVDITIPGGERIASAVVQSLTFKETVGKSPVMANSNYPVGEVDEVWQGEASITMLSSVASDFMAKLAAANKRGRASSTPFALFGAFQKRDGTILHELEIPRLYVTERGIDSSGNEAIEIPIPLYMASPSELDGVKL